MSSNKPEGRYNYLVKALRKLGEGKTPEQIEAWKAEIDRARNPELYCQNCRAALDADTPAKLTSGCTADEGQPPPESHN
jgi:hypothetical protein